MYYTRYARIRSDYLASLHCVDWHSPLTLLTTSFLPLLLPLLLTTPFDHSFLTTPLAFEHSFWPLEKCLPLRLSLIRLVDYWYAALTTSSSF